MKRQKKGLLFNHSLVLDSKSVLHRFLSTIGWFFLVLIAEETADTLDSCINDYRPMIGVMDPFQ